MHQTITPEELRTLCQPNNRSSLVKLATALLTVFTIPFLLSYLPPPILLIPLVLLNVRSFNVLAQLVHESDHGVLFHSRRANLFAGSLCANFLGYHRRGHLSTHLDHHTHLNSSRDPDAAVFGGPKHTARTLLRGLLLDLTGWTAMRRFLQYEPSGDRNFLSKNFPVLLCQSIIIGLYFYGFGWWAYPFFYLIPLCTLYPFQIRIRSAAEHGSPGGLRTFRLNPLEKFMMGVLNQGYHGEHHLYPNVPVGNLKAIAERIDLPRERSYLGFVMREYFLGYRVQKAKCENLKSKAQN